MKKVYITAAMAALLLGSSTLTSCIGSFALTNRVLSWNKQVGSKFVNELVIQYLHQPRRSTRTMAVISLTVTEKATR